MTGVDSPAQQVSIPRIDLMPNQPTPYAMRNWKDVARGYDSLAFNLQASGQYLPLIALNPNTVNYPGHGSFFLHSYVGTHAPTSSEAVNTLPAVLGATLSGVDKSNKGGLNWVLMSEEWFNRRPEENLYLNAPTATSGDDWWYETMPNVFFYQLYSRYPHTGDFDSQFRTVADRWLQAVAGMGGRTTPWMPPSMYYRAWSFSTMTPNATGVPEPEAAGAIGWILYHTYIVTGEEQYRIGAELSIEYLNKLGTNPSYELQLPYGVTVAARMNAELGTQYDIAKLLNWCFDVGPLREWGAVVGRWGDYDCSGLIGEINGTNNYAFAMNTFEAVGALVPLVRYDDRFARAIGKWVLNAANAARLFYPNSLPDANQDDALWSRQHDPGSTIAYEALRQSSGGVSPYATGDAVAGGWAATNLGLYGSSHVGILGGIVDTTNVPMVLRLDLLKTDYFHPPAYPSFLYFNPSPSSVDINVDVGAGVFDLYDAAGNTFLQTGVSGGTSITLPSDAAVVLVIIPSGGTVTYDRGMMLINGVLVDYRSGQTPPNYPPRIKALGADSTRIVKGSFVTVYCTAVDRETSTLTYKWASSAGRITGTTDNILFSAPDSIGTCTVTCTVEDQGGARDTAQVDLHIVAAINRPPLIGDILAHPRKIDLGMQSTIQCIASDPDGETLAYAWSAPSGTISGSGAFVTWTAPSVEGYYQVRCTVTDTSGSKAVDSIGIVVRDFSQSQTGQLIAYYPFSASAVDSSGNGHTGVVSQATPVPDRHGQANSAYSFNGVSSSIRVPNDAGLNFQNAISINFWMIVDAFYDREQYPISHGNWENRWKTSISNKHLRWTVKTTEGTADLDSDHELVLDSLYNVTVVYSGADMEVYLNGELDGYRSWSGQIMTTSIDMTIGQVLPSNNNYNFRGTLDDLRIYDYALSVAEILALADVLVSAGPVDPLTLPRFPQLSPNYPNPFNPSTTVKVFLPHDGPMSLEVFDILGRRVATLSEGTMTRGEHTFTWEATGRSSGVYYCRLKTGELSITHTMLLMR